MLLLALLVSLTLPTIAQNGSSAILTSGGTIVHNSSSATQVNVYANNVITSNNLSIGFAIDHHWNIWLNTPSYAKLAEAANFKLISVYDSSDDSGVSIQPCTYWNETTHTGIFNWANIDALVESFYQIGAQPIICLGGTAGSTKVYFPSGMNINATTSLPSPQDYANYAAAWVAHFKAVGLPVEYYEIFNEIEQLYFVNNTNYNAAELSVFFADYMATYTSMHSENNQILVGNDASTYKNFLNYWEAHGGKLDFLAFHKYDCSLTQPDSVGLANVGTKFFTSDGTYYGVVDARQLLNESIPIISSEYGWDAAWENGTDPREQQLVSAVALALTLRQEALLNMQYNLYYCWDSSASWQASIGTGLGFGMVNQDTDQPWYPYYVNEFIGQSLSVGDPIVNSAYSNQNLQTLSWIHSGKLFTLVICTVNTPTTISFGTFVKTGNYSLIDNAFPYTSPEVQTGKLGSNNQITVKGYAVLLLESSLS